MLADKFGIVDAEIVPMAVDLPIVPTVVESKDEDIDQQARGDIDYARQNVYQLVEFGKEALVSALALAKQSENSRSIEAFAALLKSVGDANKQLVDIQVQKKDLRAPKVEQSTSGTSINNAVFVGSTNELAAMLKGLKNG